MQMVITA